MCRTRFELLLQFHLTVMGDNMAVICKPNHAQHAYHNRKPIHDMWTVFSVRTPSGVIICMPWGWKSYCVWTHAWWTAKVTTLPSSAKDLERTFCWMWHLFWDVAATDGGYYFWTSDVHVNHNSKPMKATVSVHDTIWNDHCELQYAMLCFLCNLRQKIVVHGVEM